MILVFGSVNVDLVARVPRLPAAGETLSGSSLAMLPGGKGANQALAARRAGAAVALVGAVGSDAFATSALAGLRASGVDLRGVRVEEGSTGVALIHVDADAENAITVIPGANARAGAMSIAANHWAQATTLLLQLEVPIEEVTAAAIEARRRGLRVVLNAAPMQPLPAALLAVVDVLIINEGEARALATQLQVEFGRTGPATALAQRLGLALVLTQGALGAEVVHTGGHLHATPPPVTVVDTTGAGDAFTGALVTALDRGEAWPRALREAVAAGAMACTALGAQSSLPDRAAIEAGVLRVELKDLHRAPGE